MAIRPIRVIIEGIDRLSEKLEAPLKKIEKVGQRLSKFGRTLTIGVTLPLLAAGFGAFKFSTELNEGMANVATLIPQSSARVLELKKNVQDLAIATGQGTSDIVGGLYQVISAFGDSADTAKILEINTKAGVAGIATTLDAINLTSAVTKAYGDTSASAVAKVSDLAFMTVKLGQTTFPELANSIGRVAPLAETLGMKMEEVFGVLATTTGVTGNTAEASTQLGAILTALVKPTAVMSSLLQHLGYASGRAMMKELGFAKTLETLVGKSESAGVSLGKIFGNKESLITAYALTGAQADVFSKKLEAMNHVSGATDEAFKEQAEGINKTGHQMKVMTQRLTVLAQRFGDRLAPAVLKALDIVTPFLDKLTLMKPEAMSVILVIGGIAASFGPMIYMLGKSFLFVTEFSKALRAVPALAKIASFSIKGLGIAFKFAFANPIGLAVLAIGLLIYNITLLISRWDDFKDAFAKGNFLKTMNLFMADISNSLSSFFAHIPGLGKLSDFFADAGKGFELRAQELVMEKFGPDKLSPASARYAGVVNGKKEKAEVLMRFENLPKGTRVDRITGEIDLETTTGALVPGF